MYALVLPAQPCSPDPSSASGDVALDAYGSTSLLSASARRVGPVDLQHRAFPVRQSCELGHSGELASRESDAGAWQGRARRPGRGLPTTRMVG